MNTDKKFGGVIENWTLNTLSVSVEKLHEMNRPVKINKAAILSGYVVDDPLGRWKVGWHMRSSLVVDYDAEKGIVETENTIYHVLGEENKEADMGDLITKVFY